MRRRHACVGHSAAGVLTGAQREAGTRNMRTASGRRAFSLLGWVDMARARAHPRIHIYMRTHWHFGWGSLSVTHVHLHLPPSHLCMAACSQNLDDALAKVQDMLDRAVEYVTPKEADPETIKRVKAQ